MTVSSLLAGYGGSNRFSAIGGTITTPGDGYQYHTFTGTDNFVVSGSSKTVEYLVVAGGGGAGWNNGGGGGAGGVLSGTFEATPGVYVATVGAGGAGAIIVFYGEGRSVTVPQRGSNSSISTVATSFGGGPGATASGEGAGGTPPFGSGGGGGVQSYYSQPGSAGTPGQGANGSNGVTQGFVGIGGGGGGGADGVAIFQTGGGNGRVWPPGSNTYYGGGGSGSRDIIVTGGLGGGANNNVQIYGGQFTFVNGFNGESGKGGGGGAIYIPTYGFTTIYSGSGGSGTVIIRYLL